MTSHLTLSAAARTWGKSRQTLYTDMKAGKLSVGRDERGTVHVDASEMVRAYGEPSARRDGAADETGQAQDETSNAVLKTAEIKHLVSCPRFPWTPLCPRGDRNDEVEHERD